MDTFFIPHAVFASPHDTPLTRFLRSWQKNIVQPKPKSILIISPHWHTSEPTVNVVDINDTIADFDVNGHHGHMRNVKYPAPGAPKLAMRVKELLTKSGFDKVKEDCTRGLDHSAWFPLLLMYPEADIPVCLLSIQPNMDGAHHYNIGKALASLREEGVLIIGSGATTNNDAFISRDGGPVYSWALEFDAWLKESLLNGRYEEVMHFKKAPHIEMAHPQVDHLLPLLVALGAAGEEAKADLIHDGLVNRCISYVSYRFTTH